ncbi:hypothetical protein MKX01_005833 [Papaver californicum]|nr:hypothetical protein MKX01_005833 [Papaver californicum]
MDFDDDDDQEEGLEDEEDEEMGMATPVSRPKVVTNNLGSAVGVAGGGDTSVGGGGLVRKLSGGVVGGNNGGASSSSMLMTCSNIRYRECLKNHAIGVGGHAVDGCGEFMPAGDDGTLDALKCAACHCHRNFHRKEVTEGGSTEAASSSLHHHHHHQHPHHHVTSHHHQHHPFTPQYYRPPGNYIPMVTPHSRPLALPSTSGGGGHSRDIDLQDDDVSNPSGGGGMGGGSSSSKKRFRTKFTQEQKDKMLGFSERLGWRIQKHDEAAVQQFCNELCIKRQVLKVWMHNNKHTLGKKP